MPSRKFHQKPVQSGSSIRSERRIGRRHFMAGLSVATAALTVSSFSRTAASVTPIIALRSKILSRGLTASHWFEWVPNDPRQMTSYLNDKYTTEDFALIRSLGFDHVRVTLQPDFISPQLLSGNSLLDYNRVAIVDEAMNRILRHDLGLVLDFHAAKPIKDKMANDAAFLAVVASWWQNFATHVSHTDQYRSDRVFLELFNEPEDSFDDQQHYRVAIDLLHGAARRGAPDHTIIVGGNRMNIAESLVENFNPPLSDPNVIYTFHFYQPMDFTHQSLVNAGEHYAKLKAIPWDVDVGSMSESDIAAQDITTQPTMRAYNQKSRRKHDLLWAFVAVQKWCADHDKFAWLGEFRVYSVAARQRDRVAWIRDVRQLAEEHGFGWCHYEARGGFGLFWQDDVRPLSADADIFLALGMPSAAIPN